MKKNHILFFLLSILSFSASAENPEIIGVYDHWVSYMSTKNNKKTCYIASSPVKSTGKYSQRGDVFIFVAHYPQEKKFNEVSFSAGYTYNTKSLPSLKIDQHKSFSFKTSSSKKDMAWSKNKEDDKVIIEHMKAGNTLVVSGISKRGTKTSDFFSLKGFSKAYSDIQKKCGKK